MKLLYIFPHPDDESFGPAPVIARNRRDGHEVFLLTLTKGGATKERLKYNYSVEEMGNVRATEMQAVAKVLDLSGMTILDLPDGGLKEMDPRELERVIAAHIKEIKPDVVITYAVHGISGFPDHLICHYAVKRVYVELKEKLQLKRLALYTLTADQAATSGKFKLSHSKPEDIDCVVPLEPQDIEAFHQALDCYVTYKAVIEETGVKNTITNFVAFEFFQESHQPPLTSLTDNLS